MASEMKSMQKEAMDKLLVLAGLKTTTPSPGTALAIKADLHLPWHQLRKLQKWLASFGVHLESERVVRDSIKDLPKFTAEEVPMTSKGGSVVLAPLVCIPDLVSFVCHMLDLHEEAGTLFWHEGIPRDEVWVKFGGDHGGHSFKFCCQILNVQSPNSTQNTIPICLFAARDSPANLETALGHYRTQLASLASMKWQGKTLRVVLAGDYEYLTTNFGLSASSGVRPCLFCLCEKKAMQDTLTQQHTPRSIVSMQADNEAFVAAGGILAHAKHHNNVIRLPVHPIPLPEVIIPIFHLDLGIFPWLHDAMCTDVYSLDVALAQSSQLTIQDSDSSLFQALVSTHKSAEDARKKLEEADQNRVRCLHNCSIYYCTCRLLPQTPTPRNCKRQQVSCKRIGERV